MQDRYTGDIGDYIKYGLLRALGHGRKLGVAWYLFPDEDHNADGRHIDYLENPERWRDCDPDLFDALRGIVRNGLRQVSDVEMSGILGDAKFSGERLEVSNLTFTERSAWRAKWFCDLKSSLEGSQLVFADPDNGLCEDEKFSAGRIRNWKSIPVSEARALAEDRTAIIYHHNTRRAGGHEMEIRYWMNLLGANTIALRWRAYSARTFFVLNPTDGMTERLRRFATLWGPKAELVRQIESSTADEIAHGSCEPDHSVTQSGRATNPNKQHDGQGRRSTREKVHEPGWDAKAISRIAKERYGSYAAMFAHHNWPNTVGPKLMTAAPKLIVQTYGSIAEFVAAHEDGQ